MISNFEQKIKKAAFIYRTAFTQLLNKNYHLLNLIPKAKGVWSIPVFDLNILFKA